MNKDEAHLAIMGAISMALKDTILQQGFECICKENAELKSENQKWKDEWQEQVQKATDEGYARTLQTIQLTKAKTYLKYFIEILKKLGATKEPLVIEAEQFISEVEK